MDASESVNVENAKRSFSDGLGQREFGAHHRPSYRLGDERDDGMAVGGEDGSAKAAARSHVIPPKPNQKVAIRSNRRIYREHNRFESMIGHHKISRAIATRYNRLARSYLDTLHIAAIRNCLRPATL